MLVVKGDYKSVEKIFLIASVFYIAYIIAGVLSRPGLASRHGRNRQAPSARTSGRDKAYIYMTVGVIGTTITPWMQFYLQSSIVEKGSQRPSVQGLAPRRHRRLHLHRHRRLVHRRRLRRHPLHPRHPQHRRPLRRRPGHEAPRRRLRLHPLRRRPLQRLALRRSILPLSTAYTVCEGLGFESGLDKGFSEAKFFYWFYSLLLFAGAAVVLIPNFPLVQFSILSQVLNGVLLPLVLVFMLKLINKHELMGKYTNSRWFNIIAWLTAIIVTALSLISSGTPCTVSQTPRLSTGENKN